MRVPLFRRNQDADLEEEIQSHLELAARDRLERGESPDAAARAARRELGDVLRVREMTREVWGWTSIERFAQDLRYGARLLRKSPAFSLVAILTLALGIGANTVLFSVVANVLLAPLPYPHPEQLVSVHESKPNFASGSISYPNFRDWKRDNRSFSAMAIYRPISLALTGVGRAEELNTMLVSSDFFPILGVQPMLGRIFASGEDEIHGPPLAILSERLWNSRFGRKTEVLGSSITLDGRVFTIIGVVPNTSDIATRSTVPTDVFIAIGQWVNPLLNTRTAGLGIHGIGRLRAGVDIGQARADMERVTHNLAVAYPNEDKLIGASMFPLKESVVGNVRQILLILQAAVGFVLLIACVNVANLLLARSTARQAEFATRAALGAGRIRLIRQLLTESVLLAGIGGGLGLLLAAYGTRAALNWLPIMLPRQPEVGVNLPVFAFTAMVTLLTGVLFGLAPAFSVRTSLRDAMQQSGRVVGGAPNRTLSAFVVAQIGMALVLLVGAGLMVRSLRRLWDVNPGFNAHNILTFSFSLPPAYMRATPDAIRAAFREFDAKLASTPGVSAASETWGAMPLGYDDERLFWIEGRPKPASENEMSWTVSYVVAPDYLRLMSIPLLRGRFFARQDDEHAPLVAAIDDVFAQTYFPGENPIGHRVHLNVDQQTVEIVGVVGHVKQWGLDSDDTNSLRAQLYTPFMQLADPAMKLSPSGIGVLARYTTDSESVLRAIRATSSAMSAEQVVFAPETMDRIIAQTLAGRRIAMILLASFAMVALLLACAGLYGVVSYAVAQRTHEIGLRMALGAQPSRVLGMVLGQGARLVVIGIVAGVIGASAATRLLSGLLYGVRPFDPLTFVAVAALLCVLAVIACWIPARRAMSVEPVIALREQ